jgi:hypothetical protein
MSTVRTDKRALWVLAVVAAGLLALLAWVFAFFPLIGPFAR